MLQIYKKKLTYTRKKINFLKKIFWKKKLIWMGVGYYPISTPTLFQFCGSTPHKNKCLFNP